MSCLGRDATHVCGVKIWTGQRAVKGLAACLLGIHTAYYTGVDTILYWLPASVQVSSMDLRRINIAASPNNELPRCDNATQHPHSPIHSIADSLKVLRLLGAPLTTERQLPI